MHTNKPIENMFLLDISKESRCNINTIICPHMPSNTQTHTCLNKRKTNRHLDDEFFLDNWDPKNIQVR